MIKFDKKPDMLTRIEDKMILTLKEQTGDIFNLIEPFDESAENYEFLSGHDAAVFTLFGGSTYSPNDDAPTSAYAPRRTIRWQVYILVRSLRNAREGSISSNKAIEAVRLALQGQSLVGATPLLPISEKLDARIDNGWRWLIEFNHHIPAMADLRFGIENEPAFGPANDA